MQRPTSDDLGVLPLFGGLPAEALQRFAERAELVHVDAGQVVFEEGEAARSLYVLTHGRLDVVKRCSSLPTDNCSGAPGNGNGKGDGNGGGHVEAEVHLSPIEPGDCFGEMSFIDMQPRSATVRALEDSDLWVWTYSSIHERYCKDQKCAMLLVMNIARELSRRLRRTDELIARK